MQEHAVQERGTQKHATQVQERARGNAGRQAGFTLRHSITVTEYTVKVQLRAALGGIRGKWFDVDRLARLPLTGLARKILRKADLL